MKICKVETKSEVIDVKYEVCDEYCCKKMEKWLEIAKYHDRETLLYDTDTGRYEIRVKAASDYDSRGSSPEDEDLNFCPFCGSMLQEPKPEPRPPEPKLPKKSPLKHVPKFLGKKK